MKNSDLIRKHYDEIIKAIVDLELACAEYEVDIYLYPDGEIYGFENIGGNSWLNDDHILVYKHKARQYEDEDIEAYKEAEQWLLDSIVDDATGYLDDVIKQYEYDEIY